jgi:hypothetical protein
LKDFLSARSVEQWAGQWRRLRFEPFGLGVNCGAFCRNSCNHHACSDVFRPEHLILFTPLQVTMTQKKVQNLRKRLDSVGRQVVRSGGLSGREVEAIASKPFLFAGIRARITSQSGERETNIWSNLGFAARRAIPVMALAAALSLGLFLYVNETKSQNQTFSVDAYLEASDAGIDNLVIAERRLTGEDVLKTIVTRDDREAVK